MLVAMITSCANIRIEYGIIIHRKCCTMNCCRDWIPFGSKHGNISVSRCRLKMRHTIHLSHHHPGKYMFKEYDTSLCDMTINARAEKRRKVGELRLTTRSQRK